MATSSHMAGTEPGEQFDAIIISLVVSQAPGSLMTPSRRNAL